MPFTQEQIDFYHEHGYIHYGKILRDDELPALRDEYDRIFKEARDSGQYRNLSINSTDDKEKMKQASTQMLQIVQMCERSMLYRRLVHDARFLDLVQDILGPNIQLFHDQALFKPAHHGGAVFWHQDNAYWKCSPANLISCWMTLDDVDENNGAMQVLPGSHLKPVRHDSAQCTNILLDYGKNLDTSRAVTLPLPAGGCMFHHCQTLHYTAPNTTDRQRRAFIIHFMPIGTRSTHHKGEVIAASFANPVLRLRSM